MLLIYVIRAQWKFYQYELDENITVDEVLPENPESVKETSKMSYWENAFKPFGLNVTTKLPKHERIDTYWRKIDSIKDDSRHFKYPQLFALVKSVLSISHGTAFQNEISLSTSVSLICMATPLKMTQ